MTFLIICERMDDIMSDKNMENRYDDGNIPHVDLPMDSSVKNAKNAPDIAEPLPESTRPRKDGPGGD